ncbi:sigma-54 dependent transcriptional regulator [Celeribacter sp. PS-C1]|uniref:sigma-54-dependent transcriptional regulator n=1 Tax=Celeribacter sp. PS-C1 TaxID=2820813 RepID=UPI001C67FCC3|nr:sigma-54 dependent transcriptional regulator [Celeribacter sp. PS-C1]MBW6418366.1 sigma-54 dependent transcriptional regulator [Celeribacter sp. PS-C1]
MSHPPILIVDDVATHLTLFSATLEAQGHVVLTARSKQEALELAQTHSPRIALVDLVLPDGDGAELIERLTSRCPELKAIAVTAFATVDRAVAAMRNGAVDFLVKPLAPDQLISAIDNALAGRSIGTLPGEAIGHGDGLEGALSSSQPMKDVYETIRAVAGSAAPVFITGESGTGKVKAAVTLHAQSGFQDGAFVKLDCSTADPERIEEELLGHVATSDSPAKSGAVERANGGTLLLDEVCALSPAMQARLLNVLQTGEITPLGGPSPLPVSLRLICTSTPEPTEEVAEGRFRPDLFYRLNVVPIHLPPLRERGLEVIEIAETELDRLCAQEGRNFRTLSTPVKAIFLEHNWPGNIRELMNVLWNVALLNDGPIVEISDLPPYLRGVGISSPPGSDGATPRFPGRADPFEGRTLAEIERHAIETAIQSADGSIPAAARVLDVSPSTLYRKLETWGKPVRGARRG